MLTKVNSCGLAFDATARRAMVSLRGEQSLKLEKGRFRRSLANLEGTQHRTTLANPGCDVSFNIWAEAGPLLTGRRVRKRLVVKEKGSGFLRSPVGSSRHQ